MVEELTKRLIKNVEPITTDYEILLINDNSPDNSWNEIVKLASTNSKIRGIKLSRNFGQHHAITAGTDQVTGEWVVVMDCDLQDAPEEIPNLLRTAIDNEYQIVLARRLFKKHNFLQIVSSKIFYYILSWLTGVKQDASVANFGIYHFSVIDSLRKMKEPIRFFPAMIKWVGFNTGYCDVKHGTRLDGVSSYNFSRRLLLAMDTLLTFSNKPLILSIKIGFTLSVSALLISLTIFIMALNGYYKVTGYASIMMSIWFLSGLIILIIGVVALYLGKIFDAVKARPIYIIEKQIN